MLAWRAYPICGDTADLPFTAIATVGVCCRAIHYWVIEFAAYQKIWRLAGVDHLHVNGLQNKFWEPDDSVVASIQSCLTPLWPDAAHCAMPVIASGQWGGRAPETFRRTQTLDVMYVAGGGIMAHPDGPAAGVNAIRQA